MYNRRHDSVDSRTRKKVRKLSSWLKTYEVGDKPCNTKLYFALANRCGWIIMREFSLSLWLCLPHWKELWAHWSSWPYIFIPKKMQYYRARCLEHVKLHTTVHDPSSLTSSDQAKFKNISIHIYYSVYLLLVCSSKSAYCIMGSAELRPPHWPSTANPRILSIILDTWYVYSTPFKMRSNA